MLRRLLDSGTRTAERMRALSWAARPGVSVGAGVHVARGCRLRMHPDARLQLGDRCYLDEGTVVSVSGTGSVVLGAGVFVGHHSTIAAVDRIEIGHGTFLAEMVSVRDHDHAVGVPPAWGRLDTASVHIGVDVWIGGKASVLRGTRIGDRAILGAHAVARGDLPAGALAVGVPAVVKRVRAERPPAP